MRSGRIPRYWRTAPRAVLAACLSNAQSAVIGAVGSPSKVPLARGAGCDHGIVGRDIDVAAEVAALTGGRGVDVAYDGIGGAMLRKTVGLRAPLRHRRQHRPGGWTNSTP
jgi:threonine dehydrogenase-like Zn-dependent dehydrogenase